MAYTPYNPYINPYYQVPNNQQMQQPMLPQMPQTQPQQNNQGLIWVSGEVGAKSYLVAPNTTIMLMDSETSRFYIKSTDGAGMPNIRTFEYKECIQNVPQAPQNNVNDMSEQFVTKTEYKAMYEKYEQLASMIEDLQKPKTKKKEVNENE